MTYAEKQVNWKMILEVFLFMNRELKKCGKPPAKRDLWSEPLSSNI